MKKIKSFLSLILCLAMLLSTLPMSVFAASNESDFSYSLLSDGTIKITGYSGSDTEITIPDTINGKQVSAIGDYLFYVSYGSTSNIVSVEVPEKVTSIGEGAFARCTSLKSIILPKTLTSIGRMCFYDLGSLTINFCGSSSEWSSITKGQSWSTYSRLTINYEFNRPIKPWFDPTFDGGDGSEENPYQVRTAEQLNYIRNNPYAHYIQTANIDIGDYSNWVPIGDTNIPFQGGYDGNNYTIYNLSIRDVTNEGYFGLFGVASEGVYLKNVNLYAVDVNIADSSTSQYEYAGSGSFRYAYGGSLLARSYDAVIDNCTTHGRMSISGLLNCEETHMCSSYVGGICGSIGNASNSVNYIDIIVSGCRIYAGGITSEYGNIENCKNYGDISCYSNNIALSDSLDWIYCGGLCASNIYDDVISSSNYGKITAYGKSIARAGGVCGDSSSYTNIENCTNKGDVFAQTMYVNSSASGVCVGGILANDCDIETGNVNNCINFGDLTARAGDEEGESTSTFPAHCYCGGIVAYNISGTVENCYNYGLEFIGTSETSSSDYTPSIGRICGYSVDKLQDNYSINTTTLNSITPNTYIGSNKINGASLTKEELDNKINGNDTSDPSIDDFIEKILYGEDRLSLGQDINGYVGEVVNSLIVYSSKEHNITALDITSGNANIVEIGTIEIGVGDYITSENEHMATIPLKLKAEGTSTITITSPEGVSESVKVTVTADPISDFNAVTYVADRWLDESDVHYPTIHNFMYNFKDPSYETIKILSTDKDFLASVAAWETANVLNDPTQIADDMVNKQQYYEAILFSLLSTQFEEGSLTDYIKATEITKTYKFTKNFTKFVNSIEGIDSHNILTKTLTESEKALISNDLKSLNSSQLLEGLSSCEILIDILDYSKDIEEFVNICGKYLTLLEVQSSTEKLLDTMYELCEVNLLSNADRVCLKEALRCVKNACNSQFGVMLAGIEKGTTQVLQWTADAMCAEMWKTLCSSNVYVLCLKAGLSVGITISNTVFSTDKTIAQYYSMLCLNDVRQLINQAVVKLGQDYKTSKTQKNAEAYISAVGFVFDSYLLGCNYAVDFQKIVRKDSLAGKILFKNDNSFESFKKQAESLENEVSLNYTLLQKQWCYNLLDDYPELFEAVAKEIDLQFYANLEHSSIRVDGLSFDYTGKEITPNITVVMNGEKLVLDKDFTVAYSNNVNPGVANVEVTGIGDYHGTNTATFNINEQWFDKKVDIRNNGRATLMRAFSLRSVSTVSNENSTEAPISIHVYDGDKEVALIENGEIVHSDIHVVVYGDRVTILMDNKDYRIVVNADQNTNIDYSYNEYDKELILTKTSNYNNTILTPDTALTQTTGTDIIMCGSDALAPTYSTLHQNNETHHISVVGGAASSKEASQGEWVSVAAIVPDGYKFIEWQVSTDVSLLDKNSPSTSFVMSDCDIELIAIFEEELLVDISGSITSFGNAEDTVTIKLLQGSIEIDSVQTTNNSYAFEGVVSGTYTLEVSKADHVTRTYEIIVTDENLAQNVKIHLLGDINGDGRVNTIDVNRVYAHVRETNPLTGYELECANVAGSGSTVNTIDVNRIYAHVKETNLLW